MMAFYSDSQRKHVMAMMGGRRDELDIIKEKASKPIMIRAIHDDERTLSGNYEKMVDDFERGYSKMKSDFSKECERIMFSEKRGSVPLLPSTFVIRGSVPKQRQKIKRALDMIGDEAVMKDVNNILITPEQELPLVMLSDNTMSLSERFLTGSDGEIAKFVLSSAYRRVHPEEPEGAEFAYATEVVDPKVRDVMRKEHERRRLEELEVYQVGAEKQPEFEAVSKQSSEEGYEVKVVMPEVETTLEEPIKMPGVGPDPDKYIEQVEQKALAPSLFYGGEK
jgi:hypothetical protein